MPTPRYARLASIVNILQRIEWELESRLRWRISHLSIDQGHGDELKSSTAKVINKDDKYQQILEKLHRLETTVKPSMNDVA
ncbi:hypothetical protein EPI10_027529 [Gossypium australe]|uniref:Uncharacterized protein n=1 Tax=Gossypium australe TaxID=47621 RepID=A0A5B6US43_9ROSI|nr:hypothetical protein EPI10_027529 [Gossypium australe]